MRLDVYVVPCVLLCVGLAKSPGVGIGGVHLLLQ